MDLTDSVACLLTMYYIFGIAYPKALENTLGCFRHPDSGQNRNSCVMVMHCVGYYVTCIYMIVFDQGINPSWSHFANKNLLEILSKHLRE